MTGAEGMVFFTDDAVYIGARGTLRTLIMTDKTDPRRDALEHDLKTDGAVFEAVLHRRKTFEIRRDDRDFRVGDTLMLRETRHTGAEMQAGAKLEYTGRECRRLVTHILRGPIYGLAEGWAILSIRDDQEFTPDARIPKDAGELQRSTHGEYPSPQLAASRPDLVEEYNRAASRGELSEGPRAARGRSSDAAEIEVALRGLVEHAWIHSGYARCGYKKMTSEQRALFDIIVGDPEPEEVLWSDRYVAERARLGSPLRKPETAPATEGADAEGDGAAPASGEARANTVDSQREVRGIVDDVAAALDRIGDMIKPSGDLPSTAQLREASRALGEWATVLRTLDPALIEDVGARYQTAAAARAPAPGATIGYAVAVSRTRKVAVAVTYDCRSEDEAVGWAIRATDAKWANAGAVTGWAVTSLRAPDRERGHGRDETPQAIPCPEHVDGVHEWGLPGRSKATLVCELCGESVSLAGGDDDE